MRILLIEDDEILGDGLAAGLEQESHTVDWLTDGATARDALANDQFDAIILDLTLPTYSGQALLAEWRAAGRDEPVLILTARDELADRVHILDLGADDYLVKPIALEELAARLRALSRRRHGHIDNELVCGPIRFDPRHHVLTVNEQPYALTRNEGVLLEALIERPGQTKTREQPHSRLYGWHDGPESNSLEVHIYNLRRKLGCERIETVRGIGYRMTQALD